MSRAAEIYPADRLTLREVGLRDGLQMAKTWPDTTAKEDWIRREHAAGVRHFEIGSFLPATRFPQFADVPDLAQAAALMAEAAADPTGLSRAQWGDVNHVAEPERGPAVSRLWSVLSRESKPTRSRHNDGTRRRNSGSKDPPHRRVQQ